LDEDTGAISTSSSGKARQSGRSQPSGPPPLAIDVLQTLEEVIAVVWRPNRRPDEGWAALRGTATAVQAFKDLRDAANLLDISLHAVVGGSLVADLAAAGGLCDSVTTMAMAQASGALVDLVTTGKSSTRPAGLNAAVAAARLRNTRRPAGGSPRP